MTVSYRAARVEDASALAALARETFVETFGHLYRPEDLDAFLDEHKTDAAWAKALADPQSRTRVAEDGGVLVGYCKVGLVPTLDYDCAGKRVSELLCSIAAEQSDINIKIARCFAFIGPHLPLHTHFAAGNFLGDALHGKDIRIRGNGTPLRSYLHAADLTIWLLAILARGCASHAYNVGDHQGISIAALAELIATIAGNEIHVIVQNLPDECPIDQYIPDTQRAQKELGLKCLITLDDAIRRTLSWLQLTASCPLQTPSDSAI